MVVLWVATHGLGMANHHLCSRVHNFLSVIGGPLKNGLGVAMGRQMPAEAASQLSVVATRGRKRGVLARDLAVCAPGPGKAGGSPSA